MHGDQQCGRQGNSQKVVENEIRRSRELRGCRMPSMCPHTLRILFATYRGFSDFFSPPLNLYWSSGRRWNWMQGNWEASHNTWLSWTWRNTRDKTPELVAKGRNAAISLGKGWLCPNENVLRCLKVNSLSSPQELSLPVGFPKITSKTSPPCGSWWLPEVG